MTIKSILSILILGIFYFPTLLAQDPIADKMGQFESYYNETYQEIIYVQADKKVYLAGERIKFKIYCLEQLMLTPSDLSKVAYLEILDTENTPKLQVKILLKNGMGYGEVLIPSNINSGNFVMRSYTRWMQNFGAETFHHSMITIINPFKKAGLKPKQEDSVISVNFFPEGDKIIYGEKTKIVFEAKDEHNNPVNFSGKLFANDSTLVTEFRSQKNEMGVFEFTPTASENYHIQLLRKNGQISIHALPKPANTGLILKVIKLESKYLVNIFCNDASITTDNLFYITHGNGSIIEHKNISLSNGRYSFEIDEDVLEAGVSTISLFDAKGNQLAVRSIFKNANKNGLSLRMAKTKFKPRDKVVIDLTSLEENVDSINLSVSVAAVHNNFKSNHQNLAARLLLKNAIGNQIINPEVYFESTDIETSIDNLLIAYGNKNFSWQNTDTIKQVKYIPEYQGQLITGKVYDKYTNEPAQLILTYLSIPGKNALFYASKSNKAGSVVFEIEEIYGDNKIIIQNDYSKDTIYNIVIDNPFAEDYQNYKLPVFDLEESTKDWIVQMSRNAQIENANLKFLPKTSFLSSTDSSYFYNEPDHSYLLDDYTRFIVMEEVMREYVYGINVRKNKNGFHFMTIDIERKIVYEDNPLMLLDGVPFFDANEIIAFDPLKIKKIETVNLRFFKGVLDCKGIVNYSTYDGDLAGWQLNENAVVMDYKGVQPLKKYNYPEYNTAYERRTTTPDFRNTLYWNPEIKISSNQAKSIEFYTSDDQNTYLVQIDGVSNSGKPFSISSQFQVIGK